jgi:hypothetical protein
MTNPKIKAQDKVEVREKLHTWKKWFNGAHRFWTVKVSPPKN